MKSPIAISCASLTLLLATPAHADLNSDLVAWWTFNACNGVDETGRGHDLSFFGTPPDECVAGPKKKGLAYPFNGTSNYFVATHSADFNVDTAVTYSAWINPSQLNGRILSKEGSGETKFLLLDTDQRIHFYFYPCMFGVALPSAATVNLNEWTHVAATYDGAFARIYLNGQPSGLRETSASCNVGDSTSNLFIGQRWNNTSWFGGAMDDIRIYQRTLTATEISQLYSQSVKAKIEGTAVWKTTHTVTCKNVTQGTEVVLPPTKRDDWNCEGPDLKFNSGDTVQVVIDGVRQ